MAVLSSTTVILPLAGEGLRVVAQPHGCWEVTERVGVSPGLGCWAAVSSLDHGAVPKLQAEAPTPRGGGAGQVGPGSRSSGGTPDGEA